MHGFRASPHLNKIPKYIIQSPTTRLRHLSHGSFARSVKRAESRGRYPCHRISQFSTSSHTASMSTAIGRSNDDSGRGSNELGSIVPDVPAKPPSYDITLTGRFATIVPIDTTHADDLFELLKGPENASLFDYLFDEPFDSINTLRDAITKKRATTNPWTYAILLNSASSGPPKAVGISSLMRMDLPHRVIEIGSILFTPALQRTPAATEAMYLLARYVFDILQFRRYEWKCNGFNKPSMRAAVRLGFEYEGTFRQHMILKGRNRDTAWYAMVDGDWPRIKAGFEKWLDVGNFDAEGRQKRRLQELREE